MIGSCGQDSKIALHSALKCQDKLLEMNFHSGNEDPTSVNCCAFSPKSKYMAAGGANGALKIWEMKGAKERDPFRKLKGNGGSISTLSWYNGEEYIVSGSTYGDIFIYDVLTGAIRETVPTKSQ